MLKGYLVHLVNVSNDASWLKEWKLLPLARGPSFSGLMHSWSYRKREREREMPRRAVYANVEIRTAFEEVDSV